MRNIKLVFVFCLILFCSCGLNETKYFCDIEQVESIKIVELGEYIEKDMEFEHIVLREITNYSEFIDRLNDMEQHEMWFGDPHVFYKGAIAIEIKYLNGDYDLISCIVLMKCRAGSIDFEQIKFDSKQFYELVGQKQTEDGSVSGQ